MCGLLSWIQILILAARFIVYKIQWTVDVHLPKIFLHSNLIFSKVNDSIRTCIVQGLSLLTCTAFKIHHKNMNSVLNDQFRMNADILSKIKHLFLSRVCMCNYRFGIMGRYGTNLQFFWNTCGLFLIKCHESVCHSKRNYFIELQN